MLDRFSLRSLVLAGLSMVLSACTQDRSPTAPEIPEAPALLVSGTSGSAVAYVPNRNSNTVSVIDAGTGSVVATIPVGDRPTEVAFSGDGSEAFVVNSSSEEITVIDVATHTVTRTVSVAVGDRTIGLAVTANGGTAYVTSNATGEVLVVDLTGGGVTNTIPVGVQPAFPELSPDESTVWIANAQSDEVSIIDVATETVVQTVPVGDQPTTLDFAPDGSTVFVADFVSDQISVIDVASRTVTATFPTAHAPNGVGITPDGSTLFVSHAGDQEVRALDATTGSVLGVASTLGYNTLGKLAVSPDGSTVYAGALQGYVLVIDAASVTLTNAIAVGQTPGQLAFAPAAANEPPSINAISLPEDPTELGTAVEVDFSFTDPNSGDTHTASVNWGDGTSSAANVTDGSGSGTGEATHLYGAPGVYSISVTVEDDAGASTTRTSADFIVIFDPSGGFVTGGGWIASPAGAYAADPTLTGKASFGFVSKYKKGANTPSGSTEFQFKAGDLRFRSTSYDWLVIAGARAQYKGLGTVNGSGSYGFMLVAIDGAVNGGGGIDRFRIKIWDATETVVYDNEPGADDDAGPSTALERGSIRIHYR